MRMNRPLRLHVIIVIAMLLISACGTSERSQSVTSDGESASSSTQSESQADMPAQINGPCATADERIQIDGTDVVCMRNSVGNLAWEPVRSSLTGDGGFTNEQSQCLIQTLGTDEFNRLTQSMTNPSSTQQDALRTCGITPPSGQNQPQGHTNDMAQLGMACDSPGQIVFANELYICKDGTWRYPIPGDVPTNTDGSKPRWYPELDQLVGQQPATCPPSEVSFTQSFLPVDQLDASIPHGAMIGDHVTPIDHAYIGIKPMRTAPSARTDADYLPITAPTDGVIIEASSLGSPTSHRVVISHGCGVYTVYMVVNRLTGVLAELAEQVQRQGYMKTNVPVAAGEEFGRQRDNPLDFNVWAADTWLTGFVDPLSYWYGEPWKPYTADPERFFTPELATQYRDIMQRTTPPRWGKIDLDVAGSAAGNWFLADTIGYSGRLISDYVNATTPLQGGQVPGKQTYAYGHLAIVPHEVDTNAWVFSVGWWQNPAGDPKQIYLVIGDTQKTPDQITPADGVVVYGLADGQRLDANGAPVQMDPNNPGTPMPIGYTIGIGQAVGSVAMQVNDDGTLSIELFPSQPDIQVTQLSDQKRTYRR